MYVVTYKGNVIIGVIPWNNTYIMNVMRSRHREIVEIPKIEPDASQFPYQVNENCVIYRAQEDRPGPINPLIEYYYGPVWEFVDDSVIAHYEIKDLDIESARNNYKEKAAKIRYDKEILGTNVTINGTEHHIETNRESRAKFVEKLSSTSTDPIKWKFKESWQIITKEDIQLIIDQIDTYVQSVFDEEYDLSVLIDQAQTGAELLAIEALNIVEEPLYDI